MLRETHKQILIQASVGHWPSVLTQLCAQAATSLPNPGFYTMRKLGYIIDPHLNSGIPLSHHNLSPLLLSHPRAITALTTQLRSHLNPPSGHAHARGETGPQTGSPRLLALFSGMPHNFTISLFVWQSVQIKHPFFPSLLFSLLPSLLSPLCIVVLSKKFAQTYHPVALPFPFSMWAHIHFLSSGYSGKHFTASVCLLLEAQAKREDVSRETS